MNLNEKLELNVEALKAGRMIIVTDDADRENEGDFIMAAEFVNDTDINFMARWGRGLICAPITKQHAKKLNLPLMVSSNESNHETAFTVSIDASEGITTGISTEDRAKTLRLLASENSKPQDFARPGHIFPLIAKDQGVLERDGHTEATIDLLKISGLKEVGIICEIMNEDGTMARGQDLITLSKNFDMPMISVAEIKEYLINLKENKKIEENL